MEKGKPSRTAWAAAVHRAAHQVLEHGRIFHDPLAVRMLGEAASQSVREAEERASSRGIRMFIAARHRFAEDALAAEIAQDLRQVVVLGAGLDTYAYRCPPREGLRIFEVDHPATQDWKRERLKNAEITVPGWVTFAPVDFEQQTLAEGLAAAGFHRGEATFFTWLGVVPYLTDTAIWSTLEFIADVANGAHVVFDYGDHPESLTADRQAIHDRRAAHVAAQGEPWLSYFAPAELHAKLTAIGFGEIEDLGPREIAARYFPMRSGLMPEKGGHVIRASKI